MWMWILFGIMGILTLIAIGSIIYASFFMPETKVLEFLSPDMFEEKPAIIRTINGVNILQSGDKAFIIATKPMRKKDRYFNKHYSIYLVSNETKHTLPFPQNFDYEEAIEHLKLKKSGDTMETLKEGGFSLFYDVSRAIGSKEVVKPANLKELVNATLIQDLIHSGDGSMTKNTLVIVVFLVLGLIIGYLLSQAFFPRTEFLEVCKDAVMASGKVLP